MRNTGGLRIVHVSIEFSPNGGVGVFLLHLLPALQKAGHEVTIIHADPNASYIPELCGQHYVKGFNSFSSGEGITKEGGKVLELLNSIQPDVVHIQKNDNFQLETAIRKKFPTVKSLHVYDYCPSGSKFHHLLNKECNHSTGFLCVPRMVYKRCVLSKRPEVIWKFFERATEANKNNSEYAKLIVASEHVKMQAVHTGYSRDQMDVIPYFTKLPDSKGPSFGGKGKVLFVGRLVREKGVEQLLYALKFVRNLSNLTVAGDGPDRVRMETLCQEMGLSDRVCFVRWVHSAEREKLYREASVVVVPSIWPEPFGIVGIEAMSYGKPVVAFRVGGIPEWLEDGTTGFLIPPFELHQMAEKIDLLLSDQDLAQRMGESGRKKVERQFVEEQHLPLLLKTYESAMHRSTSASGTSGQ